MPEFRSENEEPKFWSENDSTEFINWQVAEFRKFPKLKPGLRTKFSAATGFDDPGPKVLESKRRTLSIVVKGRPRRTDEGTPARIRKAADIAMQYRNPALFNVSSRK